MKIVLVPLDPVHDVAVKMLNREFSQRGHQTILLPPDMKMEEIIEVCQKEIPDYIMVSRTLGYNAAELLGRFIDLVDAAGLRRKCKVVVGGKAITKELAAELGYDAGFGEKTRWEEVVAYVEGKELSEEAQRIKKSKKDITQQYTYQIKDKEFLGLLEKITDQIIDWASERTSPGVERAKIREKILKARIFGMNI